ncbi:MAG: glucose-1-phosphate adenylyltransferase [Chloroflexi bacterium]|nr:glucose-1-phosphate adenylyltransferase [Chloroflexota bacterium]
MRTVAMILAGGAGSRLSVLTQKRTKPAVPFAGKYRIIDFALSNCVNSGIFTIGVCTQYRPRSLNEHIGAGQPWDLDRMTGGVTLLQPYIGRRDSDWYQGTADAIYQNLDFVNRQNPDVVLILAGDHIYEMDYDVMITFHLERGADLTIAALKADPQEASRFGILEIDGDYNVTGFREKPSEPTGPWASMGIYAFNPRVLQDILTADHGRRRSRHDFGANIIPSMLRAHHRVHAFPFSGYWVDVGTVQAYWQAHMDLLDQSPQLDLRGRDWIIHTRSEERPPATIGRQAHIEQSLITDGCIVEGRVSQSILSPGVVVKPGATVSRSIILTDAVVEQGAVIDHAVIDKRVLIGADTHIGADDVESCRTLAGLANGLTVIGKNTIIPPGVRVGRECAIAADLGPDAFSGEPVPAGTSLGLTADDD